MLNWIVHGKYMIDYDTAIRNKHLNMLDLHVHAYIIAGKYQVPTLADHTVTEYIGLVADILSSKLPSDLPNMFTGPVNPQPRHITTGPAKKDKSAAAEVDRFLNSVVLLWKLTEVDDLFRKAVLEVIKPCLDKLMRLRMFGTMVAEMRGFFKDLANSLEEDGLEIEAIYPRNEEGLPVLAFHVKRER